MVVVGARANDKRQTGRLGEGIFRRSNQMRRAAKSRVSGVKRDCSHGAKPDRDR